MATYRALRGVTIQTVDGDPSNLVAGDIWYNNSTRKLKVRKQTAAAWATGTAINTARYDPGNGGTQTAAIIFGGHGGAPDAVAETWNGTAWTEVADLNTARQQLGGCGTTTAALAYGGHPPDAPSNIEGEAEEWDGSSWTESGDLNTARRFLSDGGTQTAGIAAGGASGAPFAAPTCTGVTETYDGSSWTEVGDLNDSTIARRGSAGTQAYLLVFGGTGPNSADTESWDGSSWTEVAALNRAIYDTGGAGTATAALQIAGQVWPPGVISWVEEWDDPVNTTATLTSS